MKKTIILVMILLLSMSSSAFAEEIREFENELVTIVATCDPVYDEKLDIHYDGYSKFVITEKASGEVTTIEVGSNKESWDFGTIYSATITSNGKAIDSDVTIHSNRMGFDKNPVLSIAYNLNDIKQSHEIRNYDDIKAPYVNVLWMNPHSTMGRFDLKFDAKPQVVEGRTVITLKPLFEKLGYSLTWDGTTKRATCTNDEYEITLQIGNSNIVVKQISTGLTKTVEAEVPPMIISGRTMIPLKAVAELTGLEVSWDGEHRTVMLEGILESESWGIGEKIATLDFESIGMKEETVEEEKASVVSGESFTKLNETLNLSGPKHDTLYTYFIKTGEKIKVWGTDVDEKKWGILDISGKVILEPKYYSLMSLNNGIVIAAHQFAAENGLIDINDQVILPLTNGLIIKEDQLYYIMGDEVNSVITAKGDIYNTSASTSDDTLIDFENGYVYDQELNKLYETKEYKIKAASKRYNYVLVEDKESNVLLLDLAGNTIVEKNSVTDVDYKYAHLFNTKDSEKLYQIGVGLIDATEKPVYLSDAFNVVLSSVVSVHKNGKTYELKGEYRNVYNEYVITTAEKTKYVYNTLTNETKEITGDIILVRDGYLVVCNEDEMISRVYDFNLNEIKINE